jgi:branched-chain amino acid transport system substrate-binding protein
VGSRSHAIRNTQYALHTTSSVFRVSCRVLRVTCCVFLLAACRFPGAVRPSVKIGLVAPFEGRYRYVGYDVIYAVRLALREANAAGGVGGYSVELVAYDDGADPAMAVQQARKLAADPEVVAAIGHFRDGTTGAALSAYAEAGIPLVAPAVLDRTFTWGEGEVYRVGPADGTLAHALLYRVQRDRAAVLVSDGGPLGAACVEAAQQHRKRIQAVVAPGTADWLGEVLAAGADVVICDADPVTAGEVVEALRGAGWEGAFLGGPELAVSDFAAVAGPAAGGAAFVTPWPFPADVPGGADFAAAYRDVSDGVPPGPLALPAYEATWVLLEALERDVAAHGRPTRTGVAAALPATDREGALGLIQFDGGHNWGGAPLYWYRIGAQGLPLPPTGLLPPAASPKLST